jgi:hypothetical protein
VDAASSSPAFGVDADSIYGRALRLPDGGYALDYGFLPPADAGSVVSFVARQASPKATLYVKIQVERDGRPAERWLRYRLAGEPGPVKGPGDAEWGYPCDVTQLRDAWCRYVVDLRAAGPKTFGTEGWKWTKTLGVRLRPSLAIAAIAIQ